MRTLRLTRLGWITLSAIVVFIGIVVLVVVQNNANTGKISIEIVAVPNDATIEMNGQRLSSGTTLVTPGIYTVLGYKAGFETKTYTQEVTDVNQKIFVLLAPASDTATTWAEQNQSRYLEAEAAAGEQVSSSTEALAKKNPIAAILPYNNYLYKIAYRIDPSDSSGSSIIVSIDATEQYRSMAIAKIIDLGYRPSDYKIEFTDYVNVFGGNE